VTTATIHTITEAAGIGLGDVLIWDALFNQPRDTVVYVDDDNGNRDWSNDQQGFGGYESSRPDSASFDSGRSRHAECRRGRFRRRRRRLQRW